ncbi:MAG: PAS domain S-box protein [Nitrospiraceae bacterium]|nr:MAG: PAS domain S-box protein [Nitrospiraceae bacterium]
MSLSIKTKISFLIVLVVFLVSTAIGSIYIIDELKEEKIFEDTFLADIQKQVETMSYVVTPHLIENDFVFMNNLVSYDGKRSYRAYVLITDDSDRILAHSDKGEIGKAFRIPSVRPGATTRERLVRRYSKDGREFIDVSHPVRAGDLILGTVRIGLTNDWLQEEITRGKQTVLKFILTAAGLIFLGVILAVFIADKIAKPILLLKQFAEKVGKGDYDLNINIERNDEVGMLARSFNQMIEDLKKTTVSKDYLDNIFKSMINTLVVISPEGKITRVNAAACTLLNYGENELIGLLLTNVIAEDEIKIKKMLRDMMADNLSIHNTNMLYRAKDGRLIPVLFSGSVMHNGDGTVQAIVFVAQDITGLKEVEEKLRQSTEELEATNREINDNRIKLQLALNEISSLIQIVIDKKDVCVRFDNPNLKKCYEVMNCSTEDCPCYGKEPMRCWNITGTFCGSHIRGNFAGQRHTCAQCPAFREAASDPIFEIGEHFNNMMHILELKTKELEDAYSELKAAQARMLQREKMASIGQLAAGVAHEINNPTGFILSNMGSLLKYTDKLTEFIGIQTDLLESFNSVEISKKLREARKKMKLDYIIGDVSQLIRESAEGADRIKKIVQNLKSFSRLDEAEYKMADINSGIENTINIVWNELKYKATLTKKYGDLPMTLCNPGQLNQVFMNVLVNAADSIEKQGELSVKTWNENGSINVSITDTGSGIPEDKINKIFEPFFTTKEAGKGTGLGLSITYDIVKKHNGEIQVSSEVGKGTTFTIKIPVVQAKTATQG